MGYETNIGLEVHLQLSTKTKAFCSCSTRFGSEPNTQTCPVCLGLPGSLPVLNRETLVSAIKVALALQCDIADYMKFDRKNYYYPDLPKNFQISQYDRPLSRNGILEISTEKGIKRIRIKRVHMEEDAGKLFHKKGYSLVDYNRAGTPLLEIVSEPDLSSPEEAHNYLTTLKSILRYLDVSDCNMEEGSLRCDANISQRKEGDDKLGVKTELKNMNSFRGVKNALEYEVERQRSLLESGQHVTQETRLWDENKNVTTAMRSKEEAHDYRYFPEPDLAPFVIDRHLIEQVRAEIPELPRARKSRFVSHFGLPDYDASVLVQERKIADFFEETVKLYDNPKAVSNWLMGDISAILNDRHTGIEQTRLSPRHLAEMLKMVDDNVISAKIAKAILPEMVNDGKAPKVLVEKKGLSQISDAAALEDIVKQVLAENGKTVNDYKSGKKNAFTFLVGQVMKATRGKANPQMVNEILRDRLDKI